MHPEIFSPEQTVLLPFIRKYIKDYYLVGGTAIALHIGHRRSVDFDLLTETKVKTSAITRHVVRSGFISKLIYHDPDEFDSVINKVRVTFSYCSFFKPSDICFHKYFRIPDLLTLSTMIFTFSNRIKWNQYLDIYFILKHYFNLDVICNKGKELFAGVFNPALFCKQLCYFKDISFAEPVEFMPGFEVSEDEVKEFLTDAALTGF